MDKKLIAEYIFQKKLITEIYPEGIVSLVSDSFSFWDVLTRIAPALKDEILNRTPNALGMAKTVFRPDSGDPVKIITGYTKDEYIEKDGKYYVRNEKDCAFSYGIELSEAEVKGAIECLWDVFGGTVNTRRFRVLHERVGLIYGDSITLDRADTILSRLADKGFDSSNVVFGVGSYTYQYVTRDSFGFAMKATAGKVDGEYREIYKDPKTDKGTKKSAKGFLRVTKDSDDNYHLTDQCTFDESLENTELRPVFRDGELLVDESISTIRQRLLSTL